MRNKSRANVSGWLALALPALVPAAALAQPLILQADNDPAPAVSDAAPASPAATPPPAPVLPPPAADAPAASAPLVAVANPLTDPRVSNGKILIIPFQPVNPNDATPWLGKSIQESMLADLTVAAPNRVMSTNQPAGTLDAAIALGKQNGARFVIAGGFVTVDRELRITGQVVDVDAGKAIAGLKATGDPTQLFRLEDALALQVRGQVLGQQVTPMQPMQPVQENPPEPAAVPPSPPQANPTGIVSPEVEGDPQYSSYAIPATPPVYGGGATAFTYYPSYSTTYVNGYDPYYYPAYSDYDYAPAFGFGYGYGYGIGCYPFGLGIGLCLGGGYSHFHYGYGYGYGRGYYGGYRGGYAYNSRGRTTVGAGLNFSAGVRTSSGIRSSAQFSTGGVRSAARISSGTPYRSSAFYQGSSFGRSTHIGGFHVSSGFSARSSIGGSAFHSSGGGISHGGGGGGMSHGGGGGGHGGGGHR